MKRIVFITFLLLSVLTNTFAQKHSVQYDTNFFNNDLVFKYPDTLNNSFLRQLKNVTASEKSRAKELLKNWYLQHALKNFHAIAAPLIEKFKKYKVEPSSIVLREMPTRWGSCTPKGKIILNPELIKAPKGCIEYVIIHELCHLIHLDHTQKFLDLQIKEMKDWEKWKMKLEELLA